MLLQELTIFDSGDMAKGNMAVFSLAVFRSVKS